MKLRGVGGILTDFGSQVGRIDDYLNSLKKEVELFDGEVVLVGFSMEAILALRYVLEEKWRQVKTVVAMSAPIRGMAVFNYLPLVISQDLRPKSLLLAEVNNLEIPTGKNLWFVYGEYDQHFLIPQSFPKGSQIETVPGTGHGAIANSYKSWEETMDKILKISNR